MEKELTKNEATLGFAGLDLAHLRKWAYDISSSWNGEDDKFMHDGSIYSEDVASGASDVVEKIDELQELLDFLTEQGV